MDIERGAANEVQLYKCSLQWPDLFTGAQRLDSFKLLQKTAVLESYRNSILVCMACVSPAFLLYGPVGFHMCHVFSSFLLLYGLHILYSCHAPCVAHASSCLSFPCSPRSFHPVRLPVSLGPLPWELGPSPSLIPPCLYMPLLRRASPPAPSLSVAEWTPCEGINYVASGILPRYTYSGREVYSRG